MGNVTTVGPDLGAGLPCGTGSPSYYGTYDQGGNVAEWLTDTEDVRRVARGGSFVEERFAMATVADSEASRTRGDLLWDPLTESAEIGFRVVELMDMCAALGGDSDGDGICDDGSDSGATDDTPCTGGETAGCDDHCTFRSNSDQANADADGRGNVCECGDASGDGFVDTVDARLIQRCSVGEFACSPQCDVTGEGYCNTIDARLIRRYAVGEFTKQDLICSELP